MKALMGWGFAAMVGAVGASAQAAITYVDATSSNTMMAASVDGPVGAGAALVTNGTDTTDGVWRLRTGFGLDPTATTPPSGTISTTSGTILESTGNSSPSDNVPRLKTSVTGLPSNTYDVYVYFWRDQNNSPWTIRAGLVDLAGTNSLTQYSAGDGTEIASDSTGRDVIQVYLGQVTGTSIDVFVEDLPATSGNTRTWYDGIGYQAVPEPASMGLLGLGTLLFIGGRKRM